MDANAAVAIIGGGWAGCAAAVTLAERGVRVALHEAAPVLGGRARRVPRDGYPLDNGQHLLLGAYVRTLPLIARVHGAQAAPVLLRRPLGIVPFAADRGDALALTVRSAPGRLGLLAGLLLADGLTWRERFANIAWFRALERAGFVRPARETVAQMLAPLPPRVARGLWEPLCIAALNTAPKAASAQVFANVLATAFGGDPRACEFVFCATDLSSAFPDAAARFVEARGGSMRTHSRAQVVAAGRDGVTLAVDGRSETAAAAIVATGPHQLPTAFAPEALHAHPPLAAALDALAGLRYEPIVTVWLGYADALALRSPMLRLDDAPGQWLVARPDIVARAEPGASPRLAAMIAVVISIDGPHMAMPHAALVAAVETQLARLRPAWPRAAWSQVVAEKRATYACTPDRVRPSGVRFAPGVYLAGDYVDTEYPATLEAAVRSGIAAADAYLADAG